MIVLRRANGGILTFRILEAIAQPLQAVDMYRLVGLGAAVAALAHGPD
jgi:hypothetical protein